MEAMASVEGKKKLASEISSVLYDEYAGKTVERQHVESLIEPQAASLVV